MDGARMRVLLQKSFSLLSRSCRYRKEAWVAGISHWEGSCFERHCFETSIFKRQRHVYSAERGMMGTTVLCIRKDDIVVIIGDGQVTIGSEIIKPNVRKVRRIGDNVIGGFAGATADAFTLFERLEAKLEEHPGQLTRAAVELAKAWRTDKYLRRLDALMVVADSEISLTITGNGDVLEPYDGVVGIGSGGSYAAAAARALIDIPSMDAETIDSLACDTLSYDKHQGFDKDPSETLPRVNRMECVPRAMRAFLPIPTHSHVRGTEGNEDSCRLLYLYQS